MTLAKKNNTKKSKAAPKAKPVVAPKITGEDVEPQKVAEITPARFPIVGIGASAGGLEALELFLANVPENSGMAFVIVQHLDPIRKDIMVELLQRGTNMEVFQVKDGMQIEANCVYIIPPNKNMSIMRGKLYLFDMTLPRGLRLPIDFFFRSLSDDQQEHSIGVILSGMGSDGTLGLRAIKEKAGVVFVQSQASAKFDNMPRSAIEAGLADVIAPVEALPGKILAWLQHMPPITKSGSFLESKTQSGLEKVLILLRGQTGHDFSLYKKPTVYRRIERRMGLHQIGRVADYVRFLQENQQEVELLFQELLIGVTNFFRDSEAWEQLKRDVLPLLLSKRTLNQPLRAWIPACSTGEEAYSLAILIQEILEDTKPTQNIILQIFATDLDKFAIEKAREGVFPVNIASDVSEKRLNRFFVKTENGYQIVKSIRETVVFATQNVIMDPPFTKLDILCCRNLLIYLMPKMQKKLLPLFHYCLNSNGFLFLGSAETIGNFTHLFTPLTGKNRLYQRLDHRLPLEAIEFPSAFTSGAGKLTDPARLQKPVDSMQTLADQLLLQTYSPAAVLTSHKGDIVFISGRTGKYLEPSAGKANWNIFVMARQGLNYELTRGFRKALHQKETVTLSNMEIGSNGEKQSVTITIQPLSEPNALNGMVMIVFRDVAQKPKPTGKPHRNTSRTKQLEQELEHVLQEAQDLREEVQTSQEELKSANEELQSTNEELSTSNEELQSLNEELHTVNQELQTSLNELSGTNDDMKNLLDSTHIATLFLDNSLCVRRFTSETGRLTRLIPGDKGRPITDIASALFYPDLADDARQVLQTLIKLEKSISLPDGTWYETRIQPYRTLDNKIDGVVITYIDITVSKKLELELRATETRLQNLLDRKEKVVK